MGGLEGRRDILTDRKPGAHYVVSGTDNAAISLIGGRKSVSDLPLGSPATLATMLEFCARHGIAPVTEAFPMAEVNAAPVHLSAGKAGRRIVLAND